VERALKGSASSREGLVMSRIVSCGICGRQNITPHFLQTLTILLSETVVLMLTASLYNQPQRREH
jgi:hypothetical protein